jgi:sigma-B regulation protein RsbU (phosphoserine phosphatase)
MSGKEITKKPLIKRINTSIIFRVFYLSLILIVLPLVLHSFWMYRRDLDQRKQELFTSLNILAETRSSFIHEIIEDKQGLLNLIEDDTQFIQSIEGNSQEESVQNYLKKVASEFKLSEIFFLEADTFFCKNSSNEILLGKDFSKYLFLISKFGEDNFVIFGVLPFIQEKRLFVGKTLYDQKTGNEIGILLATTPAEALVARLSSFVDSPYQIDISLLMEEGIIFASSDENLEMQSMQNVSPLFVQKLKASGQIGNFHVVQGEYTLKKIKKYSKAYELEGKENSLAALSPVKESAISVLLDVNENKVIILQAKLYLIQVISLLALIVIVGGGGSLLFILRMARPLKNLHEAMAKVSKGDLSARFKEDRMGFEINLVGQDFNETIDSIVRHQKEAEVQKAHKERMAQELKIGYDIQRALLPSKLPDLPGLEIANNFIPAKEVGGDFFDLFVRKDGKVFIIIADTAGKGIPACLFSFTIRSMFRSFASTYDDLKKIVEKVNALFCLDTKDSGMFVTLWAGLYEPKDNTLTFCNMGHLPAFIKKDSQVTELNTVGIALGVDDTPSIEIQAVQIEKQDILILYTDGVIEVENENHEFLGINGLKEYLQSSQETSAQLLLDGLLQKTKNFCASNEFPDDLTMLLIKFF